MELKIVKNYLTKNRCYQQNTKRTPIGIQLHTIGTAQGTAQSVADYWNQSAVSACVTYIVDCDTEGKVLQTLPEGVRTWADAGYGNNNLITFEICESDYMKYTGGANYIVTNQEKFESDIMRGYNTAVLLCADICKRYGWDPESKLPSGLYLISSHDEGRRAGLSSAHVDPTHIWEPLGLSMEGFRAAVKKAINGEFEVTESEGEEWLRVRKSWEDAASQIGAYKVLDNAIAACPPGYAVYDWNGKEVYRNSNESEGTQTSEFSSLSETEAAAKLLEICRPIAEAYGLFPSVCAAQTILESGYCKTELAQKGNNVCGMKCTLSGNTWAGSTWDGKSKVNIRTAEQDSSGNTYYIYADFRKYPCIEDSISDRCAYLLGAMNGSKKRYEGIQSCKDYKSQITLIKNGGYATDVSYISKICNIIERFGLDKCDDTTSSGNNQEESGVDTPTQAGEPYRVRKAWGTTMEGQIGAFYSLENAKKCADENPGYYVYDGEGNRIYPEITQASGSNILEQCAKFQKQLEADIKAGKNWEYHNPSKYLEEQWSNALKNNKRACNCALLARWALKEAGLIPQSTKIFYGKLGGTIQWGAGTKEAVTAACDLISIQNRTVQQLIDDGTLRPGDIVTYVNLQHTNIYAGGGKWYDAGHAYCNGVGEGAVYKSWYGEGQYNNQKVGYIIRAKGNEESNKPAGEMYIVQAGAYTKRSNAEARVQKLKAAGFDAFIKFEDNFYKIQAGAYEIKENAEKQVSKLKAAGFTAFIR